jgi:hypothetical protein
MTTLLKATNEWSSRPADQRFSSLPELHAAVTRHRDIAGIATAPYRSLHARAVDGAVQLNGRAVVTAALTHWSFGQLAMRAGAPSSYLRELPAPLAAECINHGLAQRADNAVVLFAKEPNGLTCRALTSDSYTRIWNTDITKRLLTLAERGPWQPAPTAFDGSRGLYASDHDMFAFMVDNDRRIFEKGPAGGLGRGFFAWNSEVGAASFGIMTFLYEYVCGNHRVWGAQGVAELRIRHVGNADERAFRDLAVELRRYADSSATDIERQIESARTFSLGNDKDEVLDRVFSLRVPQLSRKRIGDAYALAEQREDWYGSPRSAWGLAGGITEFARDLPFADERVALDRAAGKVMQLAF